MSTTTFSGNMSVFIKNVTSQVLEQKQRRQYLLLYKSNLMIRANMNVFMWVWALAFIPLYHWWLTSAQRLPLAHQKWSRKEAPGCSAAFPPLSCYTAGDAGAIYSPCLVSGLTLEHTAVQPFHTAAVDTSGGSAPLGGALNLCLSYARRNGLTTELLTEKRGRRRSRGRSIIYLLAFWDAIEKNKDFSVIPEVWVLVAFLGCFLFHNVAFLLSSQL